MGRAEERRARQRGGHRAAPPSSSSSPAAGVEGGGRAAARRAAKGKGGGKSGPSGKPKKSGIRRLFTWKKVLGTFFGLCLLGIGSFIVLYIMVPVPNGNAAAQAAQLQSNVYKYSDGKTVLARSGEVNREIVDLSKVPKDVQHTFVA